MKKLLITSSLIVLAIVLQSKKSNTAHFTEQEKIILVESDAKVLSKTTTLKNNLPSSRDAEVASHSDVVENLSRKVFLTPEEHNQMQVSLMSPEVRKLIQKTLSDTSMLTENNFTKRLRSLDLLYEGLKFDDQLVKSIYLDIASNILSQKASKSIKQDSKLFESFYGDRVELAFVISQISHEQKIDLLVKNPQLTEYFNRAQAMKSLYEVAL